MSADYDKGTQSSTGIPLAWTGGEGKAELPTYRDPADIAWYRATQRTRLDRAAH